MAVGDRLPGKHDLSELSGLINRTESCSLAIEFRNRNWVTGEQAEVTFQFLREESVTLVLVDAPQDEYFTVFPSNLNKTTNSP